MRPSQVAGPSNSNLYPKTGLDSLKQGDLIRAPGLVISAMPTGHSQATKSSYRSTRNPFAEPMQNTRSQKRDSGNISLRSVPRLASTMSTDTKSARKQQSTIRDPSQEILGARRPKFFIINGEIQAISDPDEDLHDAPHESSSRTAEALASGTIMDQYVVSRRSFALNFRSDFPRRWT